MSRRNMNRVNGNGGIPMSDGYYISGIPMMIPDQNLVARHGPRQMIPEFAQDFFRPSHQDFHPSFQDFFRPSFQDSRHLPTNHFAYAPNITIQNIIPDYRSNSRPSHNEPPMHRMGESEMNHYKMEGGRNGCDDRTSPDQRKYTDVDADINYNHPNHYRSSRGYHYRDMGCTRDQQTQDTIPSSYPEQENLDMYNNGMSFPEPDDYNYPQTTVRKNYAARDSSVGYPVSCTSGIIQDDCNQFCKRRDPSGPNPEFDENRRYPSYRLSDDPGVVRRNRIPSRPQHESPPNYRVGHSPTNRRPTAIIEDDPVDDPMAYDHSSIEHSIGSKVLEKVDEKSNPESAYTPVPYYGRETQEVGKQPETDHEEPEGYQPDFNGERTLEGDLDPEDQPVDLTYDMPVTDSSPGYDGDQPEGNLTEQDNITEPAEEIPEPAAVNDQEKVTGGITEGDVFSPSSEVDRRESKAPKKSIFARLLPKRGRKNKKIENDNYQPVPDEADEKGGNTEPAAVNEQEQVTGGITEGDVFSPSSEEDRREPKAPKKSIFARLFPKRGRKNKKIENDDYQPVPGEADEKGGNIMKNTRERENVAEGNLANKEVLSPKLSDARKKKTKSDKPAAAPKFNPNDTKSNSDGTVGEKKPPLKNKLGNLKAKIKKNNEVAKAKLQKAKAVAKGLFKKAFKKPKIKNPFKKKKK